MSSGLREEVQELIGKEKTELLFSFFAGQAIYFPVDRRDLQARNKKIKEEFFDGVSVDSLARRYSLSSRMIYNILSGK